MLAPVALETRGVDWMTSVAVAAGGAGVLVGAGVHVAGNRTAVGAAGAGPGSAVQLTARAASIQINTFGRI
jgi:hypothetical protein